jgi:hypothetical protein
MAKSIIWAGMTAAELGITQWMTQDMAPSAACVTSLDAAANGPGDFVTSLWLFLRREPRRPIGGGEREAEADAFERQVDGFNSQRLARP